MSAEENKAIVRRFFEEGVNTGNMAVVDKCVATESLKQHVAELRNAFPDFRFTIKEQLTNAQGDVVVVRLSGRGTHQGAFEGIPPTGKQVKVPGLAIYWLAHGKIVDHMSQADTVNLAENLGRIALEGQPSA